MRGCEKDKDTLDQKTREKCRAVGASQRLRVRLRVGARQRVFLFWRFSFQVSKSEPTFFSQSFPRKGKNKKIGYFFAFHSSPLPSLPPVCSHHNFTQINLNNSLAKQHKVQIDCPSYFSQVLHKNLILTLLILCPFLSVPSLTPLSTRLTSFPLSHRPPLPCPTRHCSRYILFPTLLPQTFTRISS